MAGEKKKEKINKIPDNIVFGLDIGTRSIVGTVGYKDKREHFTVIAQYSVQHDTRAMLDGQIHDVGRVAESIRQVKDKLENDLGIELKETCIAAAGRVLKTSEQRAQMDFEEDTVISPEMMYSLEMLGVEQAHIKLHESEENDRYYCVGYSVKSYYQNDHAISNLEGHKCRHAAVELIATFLPDEVVDGLYAAVERAGLNVANLTLEPIAAINVAIPEKFRLLNIALVDVGAGTSDISITKEGCIIAYGMIPSAGDEFTECLALHYLVDFQEAERLKCASTTSNEIEFEDIMGIKKSVSSEEIKEVVSDTVHNITKSISDKIKELNGGKTVSAVFIVGGGGKILGFEESLADALELPHERVALRGNEIFRQIDFLQEDIEVDSLLVTPVGICLNYYEQRNNFIFVYVNGERIRLYDNNKLTILDAALQVGLPNEALFPQRGDAVNYMVNGQRRMLRGEAGEAAVIRLNGQVTGINAPIEQNDSIVIEESTKGEKRVLTIGELPEFKSTLSYYVNGKKIVCPRFVSVNGVLESEFYEIQDQDEIEILDYYTLDQVKEFMDIETEGMPMVNNITATGDTRVYENFTVDMEIIPEELIPEKKDGEEKKTGSDGQQPDDTKKDTPENPQDLENDGDDTSEKREDEIIKDIDIFVNGVVHTLSGKSKYILVDVLDVYNFDTSTPKGTRALVQINDVDAGFTEEVNENDHITLKWINE